MSTENTHLLDRLVIFITQLDNDLRNIYGKFHKIIIIRYVIMVAKKVKYGNKVDLNVSKKSKF